MRVKLSEKSIPLHPFFQEGDLLFAKKNMKTTKSGHNIFCTYFYLLIHNSSLKKSPAFQRELHEKKLLALLLLFLNKFF